MEDIVKKQIQYIAQYHSSFGFAGVTPAVTPSAPYTAADFPTWASKQSYMTNIDTQLKALKTAHGKMIDNIIARSKKMQGFNKEIKKFMDKISGPEGIIARLKCRWIGTQLDQTTNALCHAFATPLFWFGYYLGYAACFGTCLIPGVFYMRDMWGKGSKRGYDITGKKLDNPEYGVHLFKPKVNNGVGGKGGMPGGQGGVGGNTVAPQAAKLPMVTK